jgi:hypothetical protein
MVKYKRWVLQLLLLICVTFLLLGNVFGDSTTVNYTISISSSYSYPVTKQFTLDSATTVSWNIDMSRAITSKPTNLGSDCNYTPAYFAITGNGLTITAQKGTRELNPGTYSIQLFGGSYNSRSGSGYGYASGTLNYSVTYNWNFYHLTFNNSDRNYTLYLPAKYPKTGVYTGDNIYGIGLDGNNIVTKDYDVPVWYSCSIDPCGGWGGTTQQPYPYVKVQTYKLSDNTQTGFPVNLDSGYYGAGTHSDNFFILKAGEYMKILVQTSHWRDWLSSGTLSCYLNLDYKYDDIRPGKPGRPVIPDPAGGTYDETTHTYYIHQKMQLQWTKAEDTGPIFHGSPIVSKVCNYKIIAASPGSRNLETICDEPDPDNLSSKFSYIGSGDVSQMMVSGKPYTITVYAQDREQFSHKNQYDSNNWGDASDSIYVVYDNEPPKGLTRPQIKAQDLIKGQYTHNPRMEWSWNPATDNLINGLKEYQYRIYTDKNNPPETWIRNGLNTSVIYDAQADGTYYCQVKAVDIAGNESDTFTDGFTGQVTLDRTVPDVTFPAYPIQLTGTNGILTWNPVTTDVSGIEKYEVAVTETLQTPTTGDTVDKDDNGQWTKQLKNLSWSRTYYAWVRAHDKAGNSGEWHHTDVFPGFSYTGPAMGLKTKLDTQTFTVTPRVLYQGNELRFRVGYRIKGTSIAEYGSWHTNTGSVQFTTDGNWEWWLEAQEYQSGAYGAVPVGPVQITGTSEFMLDKAAPAGSFSVKAWDMVTDLTTKPTNQPYVYIIPQEIRDNEGTVNSGIKGFYLWNGTNNTRPEGAVLITDLSTPIYLALLAGGENSENRNESIRVNMEIEDKAGNTSQVSKIVNLDTSPPLMPADFSHTHVVREDGARQVKIDWSSSSSDIAKFFGSYILPGGTYLEKDPFSKNQVNGNGYTGTFTLDVSNNPNKPVVLTVQAMDDAGNVSAPATYVVYTLATCGTLSHITGGFNTTDGHYFTCSLTGGIAVRQVLELCTDDQFASNVLRFDYRDGQFKANHLQAHQQYYYRLAAYNTPSTIDGVTQNDADTTIWEAAEPYTVPYTPPNAFDISTLKPSGFATTSGSISAENITIQFVYGTVSSVDNDQISYQVQWAAGNNPGPESFQNADGNQTDGFTLTLPKTTAQGQTYTWFVRATAIYNNGVLGTIDSPMIHFTVDANPPQIDQLVRPAGEYTNRDAVAITVHDDLSGIAKVTYQKTGETTQTTIPLTPNSTTGQWTGQIPLPEGEYNLEVYVYDNAGNITADTTTLYNMKVDRTSQSPTGVQILLNTKDGQYVSAGTVPVTWQVGEADIQGVYYWLVKQLPVNLDELPLSNKNFIPNSSATVMSATLPLSGVTGDTFYLVMAAKDQANNLSSKYVSAGKILLDKTPPAISDFAISGFIQGGSSFYLANLANLILDHFQVNEDVSEITGRKYAIVETASGQEQTILSWTTDWASIQGTTLVNGHRYRIKAQAANTPGLISETATPEFIFDNSAPSNLQISGPNGMLMSGETAIFTVSATGTNSPIVGYYLAIGTENGGTDLTVKVPGNQNGWAVLTTHNSNGIIRIEIPAVDDGTYYPVLKARNAAGIESQIVNGSQFTIDNNQQKMIVHDQGPYTSHNDLLTGWWENYHNATSYQYRILGPNQIVVYPWHTTQDTRVTVQESGLIFNSGSRYQFEVKALYDGGESASGFSPGVTVDTSIPEITQLTADDYSTTYNLKLAWNGHDDESGIARVQVAVGTGPNLSDVSNGYLDVIGNTAWISCDTSGQKLQLNNNSRYYLTLRLINGAGLTIEQPSSCVIIDDTVPPIPVVVDQGKYINTNPSQPMEAQWIWSGVDPDSGNVKYEWAIVESPDQVDQATWHDAGTQMQIALTMNDFARVDTKTYYFAIRVTNGAGLTSIGLSDGILADGKAPLIPKVKLLQGINLDPSTADEVNYIANLNNLSLAINSWAASDIAQVQYTWGTAGEVDGKTLQLRDTTTNITVVTLNDSTITTLHNSDFIENGPYTILDHKRLYFLAKVLSGSGNLSAAGYSAGVILETGAPAITGVNCYRSGAQYLFDWNVNTGNSISPLNHYEVALVAGSDLNGDPSQWTWNSTGSARKYQIALTNLPEGQYYLVIRGVNCANTASRRELNEWGISPLITIDNTPPVISQFVYPPIVANRLEFHVEAADEGTGIGGYQYALGTLADYQAYSNGWVDINRLDGTLDFTIDTTNVLTNSTVYLKLRVKDGAGNWMIPDNTSQAILVDHTPPSTPVVNCNAYTNTFQFISGITFNSSDPESQVTQYQIGIVTSLEDQLNEQLPLQSMDGFDGKCIPGFNLIEGGRYYIALRTYNGAGLPSVTGYSGPITVDTNPPLLTFANAYETIVVNPIGELEPAVNIEFWLSESTNLSLRQMSDNGIFKTVNILGTAGLNHYAFKENVPQNYTITVIPTDLAGNTGNTKSQRIRVNAPPVIAIAEQFYATPNQPLDITATIIDTDSAAGDSIQYTLELGDGTENIYGTAILTEQPDGTVSCVINATHSYQNVTSENQGYSLKLTVIDKDAGMTISNNTTVKIGNTQNGTLYTDEIWSGEHHLFGTVTVPANIHLTILPGTRVIIDGTPGVEGYDIALIIHGTLTVGNNVSFDSKDGTLQKGVISNRWKGIRIEEGQASLDGAIIKHAERAIAIKTSNSVAITNCTLDENYVGLHVYQSSPTVSNSHLANNQWYGIKEDQGGRPIVTGCGFRGNEVDYYQDQVTEIDIEALNQISGNSGNYQE